jgi:hypothetical protein
MRRKSDFFEKSPKELQEAYKYLERVLEKFSWHERQQYLYETSVLIREMHDRITLAENSDIFNKLVFALKSHPSLKKGQIRINKTDLIISFEGIQSFFVKAQYQKIQVAFQSKRQYIDYNTVNEAVDCIVNYVTSVWTEQMLNA